MEITGLPLHGLVVHGAVVFGPLAALLALGYVAVRPIREHFRWPLLVAALAAGAFVALAWFSGRAHVAANPALEQLEIIGTHEDRALLALIATSVFAVVAVAATAVTRSAPARVRLAVDGLLVLTAIATLVTVVITGDAGARSVWGG